jgi:cardiolipin synthase
MSLLHVAIPIATLSTRLIVRKGQPWSVIEHLILESIARAPCARTALGQQFNLFLPIVDAALVRLSRALWIEMRCTPEGLLWVATPHGCAALAQDELPSPGRIISRPATVLIDRLAGHVFNPNELMHDRLDRVRQVSEYQPLCVLPALLPPAIFRLDELAARVRDDEQLLDIDSTSEHCGDEVAILRLRSGEVEGLPGDCERPELLEAIRAGLASTDINLTSHIDRSRQAKGSSSGKPRRHPICFDPQDLIVGGPAHRRALEEVFERAVSRIILHSTFIGEVVFRALLPSMLSAIKRGVHIDVLWGQDPPADPDVVDSRSGASVIALLNADPQIAELRDRLHLHRESTRSHAKVIVADIGRRGDYIALVGSCNWLASNLGSVEVSVRIRTPALVAQVVQCLTNLVHASDSTEPVLALTLLRIARALRRCSPPAKSNAMAHLVVGAQHQSCVLRARDHARHRIFVMSHRMSELITPAILVPFARAQARARRGMRVTVLYGRRQDDVTPEAVERVAQQARSDGITLRRIRDPRIHAKVLVWDSDSVVVTSQNWLSADAMETTLATELGLVIECRGIADRLVDNVRGIVEGYRGGEGQYRRGSRAHSRMTRART